MGAFVRQTVAFGRKILRKEWIVEVAVDENSRVYFEGTLGDAIHHFFSRIRSSLVEVVRVDATNHLPDSFFQTFVEVGPMLRPHAILIYADLGRFSATDFEN